MDVREVVRRTSSGASSGATSGLSSERPSGLPSALVLMASGWVASACALTDYALYRSTSSLTMMTIALGVLLLAGARLRWPGPQGDAGVTPERDTRTALAAALGVSLGLALPVSGIIYGTGTTAPVVLHHLNTGTAALALLVALTTSGIARVAGTVLVLGAIVVGSIITIHASPTPAIDVWGILQGGAEQMLHRQDLYTSCFPLNADPTTQCIYPYLPMTTASQLPSYLLTGDVRATYVVCLVASALLVWRLGGARWGPVLAVLMLMQPRWYFLLEQTWTEPLLILGLTVMVWGALSGRSGWAIVGFAFALACKQHVVILVPLALWWPRMGVRRTAAAVGLAAAVMAPFVVRHPRAFYDDAIDFFINLVPRPDSLSWYGFAARHQVDVPFIVVPAVMLVVLLGVVLLLPRTDSGFVLGGAVLILVFDLANKATFFNQISLIPALLVLALVCEVRRLHPPTPAVVDRTHEVGDPVGPVDPADPQPLEPARDPAPVGTT